jgi:biotin synthase-related radical SAM superfamily protein
MSSLAQVQADTLGEDVTRIVIAEQFKQDFLLVMENDYEAYTELMADTKASDSVVQLSDTLRGEWETLAEQVTELVTEQISEIAGLLIAQIIQGQGSLPFDLIAKQLRETDTDDVETVSWSSSNPTGERGE